MQSITMTITGAEEGRSVRSLLKNELQFSSHAISRLSRRETGILVNGVRAFTTAPLRAGDRLTVETGDPGRPEAAAAAADCPFPILYEDGDLLVLNKPAGLAVHASSLAPETPTVADALAVSRGGYVFHPVSRLDRGTTGLMVVAKSGYIHDRLRRIMHTGDFYREYRAVCIGTPSPEKGRIALPIGRAEGSALKRTVRPDGAEAITDYEVLETYGDCSLVRLIPQTGRTHQLRVHMAALGCPLAGDWLYGTEERDRIARPALHSYALQLVHPISGELLSLTAPLPEDMKKLLIP